MREGFGLPSSFGGKGAISNSLLTSRIGILSASMSIGRRKVHKRIALLEVRDPLIIEEIERDPGLQTFLGARLSERCIAVQPQAVEDVVKRLLALGHMPRVIE